MILLILLNGSTLTEYSNDDIMVTSLENLLLLFKLLILLKHWVGMLNSEALSYHHSMPTLPTSYSGMLVILSTLPCAKTLFTLTL